MRTPARRTVRASLCFAWRGLVGLRHDLDAYARESLTDESKFFGGRERYVDQAIPNMGAAIVNAKNNLPAVGEIGHTNPGAVRERAMRRGQLPFIVRFAECRLASVEAVSVVRRVADLCVGIGLAGSMSRGSTAEDRGRKQGAKKQEGAQGRMSHRGIIGRVSP